MEGAGWVGDGRAGRSFVCYFMLCYVMGYFVARASGGAAMIAHCERGSDELPNIIGNGGSERTFVGRVGVVYITTSM